MVLKPKTKKNTKSQIKDPIEIQNPVKPLDIAPISYPIVPKIHPNEMPNDVPEQQSNEKPSFEVPKPSEFENVTYETNHGFFM